MKLNKLAIENRIKHLSIHPIENAKLIKKWERYLRRCA